MELQDFAKTFNLITDSSLVHQVGSISKPISWGITFIRITAAVLPFITSIISRVLDMNNQDHLFVVIVLVIFSLFFMILSLIKLKD
jgi:hypothetical protein